MCLMYVNLFQNQTEDGHGDVTCGPECRINQVTLVTFPHMTTYFILNQLLSQRRLERYPLLLATTCSYYACQSRRTSLKCLGRSFDAVELLDTPLVIQGTDILWKWRIMVGYLGRLRLTDNIYRRQQGNIYTTNSTSQTHVKLGLAIDLVERDLP